MVIFGGIMDDFSKTIGDFAKKRFFGVRWLGRSAGRRTGR